MATRFVMSGGNFCYSGGPTTPGVWSSASQYTSITNAAPAGAVDSFAFTNGVQAFNCTTPFLGGDFPELIAGYRVYFNALSNNAALIGFFSNSGSSQCDVRMNGAGNLFFTRNGTVIGGPSLYALTPNVWTFIEFKATFSTSGTGLCEVRVNGVTVLSVPNVTNATTTALGALCSFYGPTTPAYIRDCYVVDGGAPSAFSLTSVDSTGDYTGTITGGAGNAYAGYRFTITGFTNAANNIVGGICTASTATTLSFAVTTITETHAGSAANYGQVGYMGDVKMVELYPNGPGVNSAWTPNVGPFSITSVANASGGDTVYTGTITGGASNAYVGYNFVMSTFAHGANNGTFACVASTATTLTLANASGVSDTTGSAAFQNIVQIGINQSGTRPNGDVAYLYDSNPGDISDFAHTPITLTGSVLGVCHLSSMRKDDAGTREVAQVCLSGSATEQGPTYSLGNTYQYWLDFIEVDPNTGAGWTASGVNGATFGIKEIS